MKPLTFKQIALMKGYGLVLNQQKETILPSDLIDEQEGSKHFDNQFDIDEEGNLHVK